MQDSKDYLTEYASFKDYLQKNLSWYEYENLWEPLGFTSKILFGRVLAGSSVVTWEFMHLIRLIRMLENPVLPGKLIKRFNLPHKMSTEEIKALDDLVKKQGALK